MLGFTSKKLFQANRIPRLIPTLFLCSAANPDSQIVTRSRKDANFTVSYLFESCGLGPEAAKCLHLGFSYNPQASGIAGRLKAVILIFKHYGFHDYLIAKLVLKKPQILLSGPDKELKPKVELLASLGAHPSTAAEILLNFPDGHLQDRFVPLVNFFRSVRFTDEEVVEMMIKFCHGDGFDPQAFLGNMVILREVGMPNSIVSHFIRTDDQKSILLFKPCDLFKKVVDEVKVMRLNPKRCVFVDAMLAVSAIGIEMYRRKSKVFKKWGWSDVDLLKAFMDNPRLLDHAEEKIDEVMDCFVNTLGFKSSVVVQCPLAFKCSKKRLISRFSVAKFLWERGVIGAESYKLSSFLETNEHLFLKRFVTKHKKIVPELFDLYAQCKTDGKPFYASYAA